MPETFSSRNAVNVAIVSVKIAEGLGYEPAKLEQIALAGLLHDLGMFVLPDSLVYKAAALTEEERPGSCRSIHSMDPACSRKLEHPIHGWGG